MGDQKKNLGQRWRAALSDAEVARVERALVDDPDVEQDFEAMLEGLSPQRRALFARRVAANLARSDNAHAALLLALADMTRAALQRESGEVTGFGDTPPGHTTP